MDDLYYCVRIMQISTEKLQSMHDYESLHRTSLIRSTLSQSRKRLWDLLHSLIKISSTTDTFLPVIIQNDNREHLSSYEQSMISFNQLPQKRKSYHIDAVKRLRIASP